MLYGLIGEKLGHSFSKEIHEKIEKYQYELKEISKDDIDDFLKSKDFLGINVTIPYKQTVIPYLDYIDEKAKEINAVNTIVNKEGKLYGYNTDYYGLKSVIEKNEIEIKNKKVLILGTGGTSKTATSVLKDMEAKEIIYASRKVNKENEYSYEEILKYHNDVNVIVNTTPCGMYPNNDDSILDISSFKNLEAVCDVIYNPLKTQIILDAIDRGLKYANGLYMLVSQAVIASNYFTNGEVDINIIDSIYKEIENKKKNIVLIGMPSSGKSTIGKALSEILDKEFVDSDELIEAKINMKIKDFLNKDNEVEFRNIETEVIKEVSKKNNLIISTGGGVIKKKENIDALRKNSIIIFIDRPLNLLQATNDRPLSNNKLDLQKLYLERYELYEKYSDIKVENDKCLTCVIEKIKELIKEGK